MGGGLSSSSLQQWENFSLSHTHHALLLRVRMFGCTFLFFADNGALPNDSRWRIQPDVVVGTRRSFSSADENQSALGDMQRC